MSAKILQAGKFWKRYKQPFNAVTFPPQIVDGSAKKSGGKNNDAAGKRDKTLVYVVRDRKDLLTKIIPFFEKYPLRTAKREDFEIFRKVVQMIERKQHFDLEGFQIIVALAFSMNANGRYRRRDKSEILKQLKSSETVR